MSATNFAGPATGNLHEQADGLSLFVVQAPVWKRTLRQLETQKGQYVPVVVDAAAARPPNQLRGQVTNRIHLLSSSVHQFVPHASPRLSARPAEAVVPAQPPPAGQMRRLPDSCCFNPTAAWRPNRTPQSNPSYIL